VTRGASADRALRILAVNWRDIRHPQAGGAEVHLHEILRRLAADGHTVSQLASSWPGAPSEEMVDGVHIHRAGAWWNANFVLAGIYLRRRWRERVDVVIEDINKIPFFTPLYANRPVVAVVPHLFGRTVFRETAWPLAAYVYVYEALIPAVYKRTLLLAISDSTRDDLVRRGLDARHIRVSYCGLDHALYTPGEPQPEPGLIVFLGRLQKYKGVQIALRALPAIRAAVNGARLVVVGDGPYRSALESMSRRMGLAGCVEFRGRVSAAEKVALLRRASVVVNPSPKEGWGLTVVEAAACGTPVVASRSPGLVDSVRDGETGFLVPHGNTGALAARVVEILRDPALRARLSAGAIQWAARFSWEQAAHEAEEILYEALAHPTRGREGVSGAQPEARAV
jgi:glycosyltransferase involved in cell wall biosynthesis